MELVQTDNHDYFVCHLRGEWFDTNVEMGMVVHVIGQFYQLDNSIVISDEQGFLIVLPNILINGTTVSDSHECIRKSFLSEKFSMPTHKPDSAAALIGTCIHEIFQHCLIQKSFSDETIENVLPEIIKNKLEPIYGLRNTGFDENALRESVKKSKQHFRSFPLGHQVSCMRIYQSILTK